MTLSTQSVRVRFAPSPTGHLHIGGLRAALFNWLFARHNNGKFLLRIEDTDLVRSTQEYTNSILASFEWAGITPDEPLVIQSHRIDEHQKVIGQLLEEGKAYRCFCSPQELEARLPKVQGAEESFSKYDGVCRTRILSADDAHKPYVVRFMVPNDQIEIVFEDLIRGRVAFDIDQFDDFIIARSDGSPMYNFVVVVDDAFMKISHVIRGEDHISNTPKQIMLYQACGYQLPAFAHLPMILGPSGERLSKRDGATSVLEYKQQGYLPNALLNYLARLGWAHGDQEIFTLDEMVQYFSLDAVGKKGAIFDWQKLTWLNGVYLRQSSDQELLDRVVRDTDPLFLEKVASWNSATVLMLIALYKERVKTLRELVDELIILHKGPLVYVPEDFAKWLLPATREHLQAVIQKLDALGTISVDIGSETIKLLAQQLGLKLVELAQPIRLALVGKTSSPGVFDLMAVLGKDETIDRLRRLALVIEQEL